MRVISRDGIGLAAMVRAAEKLQEVIDEFGLTLGVIDEPAQGKVLAIGQHDGEGEVLVTVEANPRIVTVAAEAPYNGSGASLVVGPPSGPSQTRGSHGR